MMSHFNGTTMHCVSVLVESYSAKEQNWTRIFGKGLSANSECLITKLRDLFDFIGARTRVCKDLQALQNSCYDELETIL